MTLGSSARDRLLDALRDPRMLATLDEQSWELLLAEAEALKLDGRLAYVAEAVGVSAARPLMDRLAGLRAVGADSDRALRWEVGRLLEALADTGITPVVLKGAAYVILDLPFARGRRVADVDVLVEEAQLRTAEQALLSSGWVARQLHPYDERYYRIWTHELPPMMHPRRRIPLDLHHGLVPRTSRIRPDPRRLIDRRVESGSVSVPCPAHLVLHAAVHLFHDGEIVGALRDLVDIDALLRHYREDSAFWSDLVAEMTTLGVGRSTYYAVRYATRVLDTPVPDDVRKLLRRYAPGPATVALMDRLVERALVQGDGDDRSFAAAALRLRGHWLRMPPLLLVRHLTTKAVRRATESRQRTRTPLV